MRKKAIKDKEQSQSSDQSKPFQGQYHGRLRNKKNSQQEMVIQQKKQYKNKKITERQAFWFTHVVKIERPFNINHIYNFHNILAINEHSLIDPNCEESFLTSKFYLKRINRVTIENNCLLLGMENIQSDSMPVPYICERLKSMGDIEFLRLAQMIQSLDMTFPQMKDKLSQESALTERNLPNFIQQMGSKSFFSQFSPNLLVISRQFLTLLGYEMEELAIESIKYKTILKEFFSAGSYGPIIKKHLENIQLLRNYLEGNMTIDQFCSQSLIVCQDYIFNRSNQKIKCTFIGGASRQLTPFLEIKQVSADHEDRPNEKYLNHMSQIEEIKDSYKQKEIQLLKKLTKIPKQLDPKNKCKICSFKSIKDDQQKQQ